MPKDTSFATLLRSVVGPAMMPRLWRDGLQEAQDDPVSLSHSLLTARGEASGIAIADRVLSLIEALDEPGLERCFAALRDAFEVDLDAVLKAASDARTDPAALAMLQVVAEPPRQELFRRLNAAPNGTARLVEMRRKLLEAMRRDPSLAPIDADLRHLLRSWFNRGFLVPVRIDWQTSAAVLEKIIAYEAVHAIDSWDALRERLAPGDRRCFAFFHPAMPGEPLIFVEVALTRGLSSSIQSVLQSPRALLAAGDADTAIFYSISNCQAGLAGISFGAFLIKQVAADLKAELPGLRVFSTLSPVPGFAGWAAGEGMSVETLTSDRDALLAAVARYLVEAKDGSGRPRDPVARFHLGNGAELHRLNPDGDRTARGVSQSQGVMVNYVYDLDRVGSRHEAYAASGELAVSRAVLGLLGRARPPAAAKGARPT